MFHNIVLYRFEQLTAGDVTLITVTPEDTLCVNNVQNSPGLGEDYVCRSVRIVAESEGVLTVEAASTGGGTRPPLEMELVHAWPCCGEQLGNPLSIEVSAGTEVQVNVEMPVSAQVSESFILTTRLDPSILPGDRLAVGDRLLVGQSLISNSGRYRLTYQGDGNLVLYDLATGTALWWTGTFTNRPGQAVMQGDGDLVLDDLEEEPMWGVRQVDNPGAFVVVQDDANVVVYRPDNVVLWASAGNEQ